MRLTSFLLVTILGLPAPANTQEAPSPAQQMKAAVQRMLVQRPQDPSLHFYLATAQAQAGERDNALTSLRKTGELGDGFLPAAGFGFDSLNDDAAYKALWSELEARLPVVKDAPLAFRLADKNFAPEGIAFDPVTRQFFIGSITTRQLVRVSHDGKQTPFSAPADGLQQVLGVAVDAKRRRVLAVSTNALTNSKPLDNALLVYDIDSGKRLARYPVPGARQLNDVAVASDGTLYVTDSAAGGVWKIADGRVTPFVAAGTLGGCNGLAVSQDGKILYVAHSTGIARVDTASAKLDRMPPPARQTIAAIDGLYLWNGDLIGIQNITNPGRVIRARLDRTGTQITAVDTLQSHHNQAFDLPTTGAIAGKSIYVLATTGLPQFNDKGEITSGPSLKFPVVVKVPLM